VPAPSPTQLARRAWRWLAARSPLQLLLAGWVAFATCCYPGYMSFDSIMQLGEARHGTFSDAYAPLMTQVWRLLEWLLAGPAPMLALQSGLFLVGAYGLLRRVVAPRAAALATVGVLLAPPVYAVMAVIWPDSLLAGALVAAAAGLVHPDRRAKIAGVAALVLACGCRLAIAPAAIPIAALALAGWPRPRALAGAAAIAIACAAIAQLASCVLVDDDTHATEWRLELLDVAGTARRARLHGADLDAAFAGLEVVDRARLDAWIGDGHDVYDAFGISHGDKRIVYAPIDDAEASAVDTAWRRAVTAHAGAYATHRWELFVRLLGVGDKWDPVFDDLGDRDLLAPLHHRATPSDLQLASRTVVRAVAATPLFKPWLYLALAIAFLVYARERRELPVLRALAASGLVYEIVQLVAAQGPDYRASHWLVATTWLAIVGAAVARRWPASPRP
jgi:hypothetical protein